VGITTRYQVDAGVKPPGTIRLVDKRLRLVEVFGPPPPGGTRPRLLVEVYGLPRPRELKAHCYKVDGRVATFLVDSGPAEDQLLTALARYPHAPSRPVSPYGVDGWLLKE
jgi:hypothetical protein